MTIRLLISNFCIICIYITVLNGYDIYYDLCLKTRPQYHNIMPLLEDL